ncbi:MAG: hypothetical protein HS115_19585 [Spirochaetales bacterium]|nr:hypothetical protein [Spirochaetales bacterium]
MSAFSAQEQPDYQTRKQTVEELVSRGKMEETRGAYVEAARLYARSLEIWPNHPEARARYDAIVALSAAQASQQNRYSSLDPGAVYTPATQRSTESRKTERPTPKARPEPEEKAAGGAKIEETAFREEMEKFAQEEQRARADLRLELLHLRYALYGFALLFLGQLFFQALAVILLLVALAQRRV